MAANDVTYTPSNSPESSMATGAIVPTDTIPNKSNESQQHAKIPRPTELLPLHSTARPATQSDTNNPSELNKLVNECRISSCNRCSGNCVCDNNIKKCTNANDTSAQCMANASQQRNNGHDISTNTAVSVATGNDSKTTAEQSTSTLKFNANKCVGPTPSPPHVPIFVNRFPNNYPTMLPPHIRWVGGDFRSFWVFLAFFGTFWCLAIPY